MFLCSVFGDTMVIIFLSVITIQLGYVLYFYARIFSLQNRKTGEQKPARPVSVIICAKNEAGNLKANLPSILAQRYMNDAGMRMYEVIVVNDASDDDTAGVLDTFCGQFDHLRVVTITKQDKRDLPGKKYALKRGAEQATHDILLLTDADCSPASDWWIAGMTEPFTAGKQIVAGYGQYSYAPGMLNAFVRWETLHSFLQYSSYALAGRPYMAVGRNMACTKEVLQKAQLSDVWGKLPSGDDDLLVRLSATKDNMAIVAEPGAFTVSAAPKGFSEWIKQKQRHLSTGKYYTTGIKLLLGGYAVSHALSWILFIAMLVVNWQIAIGVMAARCIVYWLLWDATAMMLKEKRTFWWYLVADIGWLIYNFAFSPYIFWKNKQRWT